MAGKKPPEPPPLLYGVKAIGDFLGLTRPQAQHRIDEGVIPTFRVGSTICSTRAILEAWISDLEEAARGQRR